MPKDEKKKASEGGEYYYDSSRMKRTLDRKYLKSQGEDVAENKTSESNHPHHSTIKQPVDYWNKKDSDHHADSHWPTYYVHTHRNESECSETKNNQHCLWLKMNRICHRHLAANAITDWRKAAIRTQLFLVNIGPGL